MEVEEVSGVKGRLWRWRLKDGGEGCTGCGCRCIGVGWRTEMGDNCRGWRLKKMIEVEDKG